MSIRKSTTSHADPVCANPGIASATSIAKPHTPNIPRGVIIRSLPAASAGSSAIPTATKNIPNPIHRIVPSGIPGSHLTSPVSSRTTIPSGMSGSHVTGPNPINTASAHDSASRHRADSLSPATRATTPSAVPLTIRRLAQPRHLTLSAISRIHHNARGIKPTSATCAGQLSAIRRIYHDTHDTIHHGVRALTAPLHPQKIPEP